MMKFERFVDLTSFGLRDIFIHRDIIVFTWITIVIPNFIILNCKTENYNSNELNSEWTLFRWLTNEMIVS